MKATATTVDGWLRRLGHELMRSPEPTRAESLVRCARAYLPDDPGLALCVVGELLTELRGRNRYAEELARASYDLLVRETA